jgi:uncharacterized protein (TIRG00374 family)
MEEIEVTSEKRRSFAGALKEMILFILRIGIAVGIIGYLIYSNYATLAEALGNFNFYWLIPAVLLYSVHLCVAAWRWRLLLHLQEIKISFMESLSLTMQGFFFSLALPGGSLGGDVVKGACIAKRAPEGKRLTGAFTILIDRVLGMIGLFSLAAIAGAVSYSLLAASSAVMEIILYSLFFGCFFGMIAVIGLFFHRHFEKIKLIKWCLDFGDGITKGAVHKLMNATDSFRSAWPTLIKIIIITIVFIHLLLAAAVYCIGRGINKPAVPKVAPEIYVLATTLGNAAGVIPITPSGTGTRDAVIGKVFAASFMADNPELTEKEAFGIAIAISLIFTSLILIFNLSGGLFFIFDKYMRKSER